MQKKSEVSKRYDAFIAKRKHEIFSPFDHESWNAQEWQEEYYSIYGDPNEPIDERFEQNQEVCRKRWEAEGKPIGFDVEAYRAKLLKDLKAEGYGVAMTLFNR